MPASLAPMRAMILALLLLPAGAIPDEMPIPAHSAGRVSAAGRFGWPGGYFEGWFKGSDVTVKLDTRGEPVRLLVDGKVRATLSEAGETSSPYRGWPRANMRCGWRR